jgi:hypothetical protein
MHPKIKGYSDTRNIVYASKLEEQKKLEALLKKKYKELNKGKVTA